MTYVQYEIYNPYTLELISLNICESNSITIKAPVKLDEDLDTIYKSLNNSGYNLFDLNDSFYNDVCSTYTTQNGTDISMIDRKNLYDSHTNISLCQSGCTFLSYDDINERVECECEVQTEETITDSDELKFDNFALVNILYKSLKYSNFLVMKCYKLLFSKEGQKDNIGSYCITIILFLFILSLFWYCVKGNKIIVKYILSLISIKKFNCNEKINNITDIIYFEKRDKHKKNKNFNNTKIIKSASKRKSKKININNNNINIYINQSNKGKINHKNNPIKKKKNKNRSSKITNESSSFSNKLIKSNINRQTNLKSPKKNILLLKQKNDKILKIDKKKKIIKKLTHNLKNLNNNLNEKKIYTDLEINDFDYKTAVLFDKRTYCQYYSSLIRRKQIILFTFCQGLDYNLIQIKINLLLFSFSLYFTVEGFFFSDDTMNNIYTLNGRYDLIYRIPQLLYSFFIWLLINILLKELSLTDRQFLSIKNENNYILLREKASKIRKNVKIRIIIFYLISSLCMFFFWYFISCFCAVYKNTQKILIYDTLVSFGFLLIYPFGFYLLPGLFRIPSLRSSKKDKNTLYFIGNFIAMI